MKIYTSYYKKLEEDSHGLIPVRISRSEPKWFIWHYETIQELYPDWCLINNIKNGKIDEDQYIQKYEEHLNSLDRNSILNKLQVISDKNGGRDIVLLCYEATDKFCHRHLVAKWLNCSVTEFDI